MEVCSASECTYKVNSNPNNNGGAYCCRICMRNSGNGPAFMRNRGVGMENNHGPACEKVVCQVLPVVVKYTNVSGGPLCVWNNVDIQNELRSLSKSNISTKNKVTTVTLPTDEQLSTLYKKLVSKTLPNNSSLVYETTGCKYEFVVESNAPTVVLSEVKEGNNKVYVVTLSNNSNYGSAQVNASG